MNKLFARSIMVLLVTQAVAMAGTLHWAPPGLYPSKSACRPIRFDQPEAVAVDAKGDIYIANAIGPNAVQEVTPEGSIRTPLNRQLEPFKSGRYFGLSLAVGSSGNVFVAVQYRGTVERLNGDGSLTVVAGKAGDRRFVDGASSDARLKAPNAIAIDPRGVVYIADTGAIRKIAADGSVSTVAGTPGGNATNQDALARPYFKNGSGSRAVFLSANAIAVDSSENVYVADSYAGRMDGQLVALGLLREVSAAGVVHTVAGTLNYNGNDFDGVGPEASFSELSGVAVFPDGSVYVTEPSSGSVRKITHSGAVTTIWTQSIASSTGLIAPSGVAAGRNKALFIVDDLAAIATTDKTPYWLHRLVNGELQTLCRESR